METENSVIAKALFGLGGLLGFLLIASTFSVTQLFR
jgi:hypothetical protein